MKFDRSKVNKFLILKHGALGDVLLSTAVIENLRHSFPDAEINFLTQKYCKEAVQGNPYINKVLTYDLALDGGWFIIKKIRKQRYDLVIDLFGNPRTALITFFSGARYKAGFRFNWRSLAYNIKVKPRGGEVHNVEFNLDTLRALGLEIIQRMPSFYVTQIHHEFAEAFFNENSLTGKKVIAVNPAGSWPTKVWGADKFSELIGKLSPAYTPLLIWGNEDEKKLALKIIADAGGIGVIAPETGIKYLAALLHKCTAFITNDTGPMHIGWVSGVTTAAIFGPTNSHLQGPLNQNSVIIKNENIDCLGCNLTKLEECPNSHNCMNGLSTDYVYQKLMELIDKQSEK